MTLRLYFDEDSLDQALIRALKARGLDVESALTAGMRRRSDLDQLDYATEQGRALCSYNVGDFCRIHRDLMAGGGQHAGLILTQQNRLTLGEHLRRLLRLAATITAEEMTNRLEFLLDRSLKSIRTERKIRPPMIRCPRCGTYGPAAERRVSVRATILAAGRFGITTPTEVKRLERSWRDHRFTRGLDPYGNPAVASDGAAAGSCTGHPTERGQP